MIGMHERVVDSTALFLWNSAACEALISADNEDSGEKDPKEQIFCRQEQSDKNSHADPEYNKTDGLFHMGRPFLLNASVIILYAAEQHKVKKNKNLFHFCLISGIIVNNYVS